MGGFIRTELTKIGLQELIPMAVKQMKRKSDKRNYGG
jgi:hypothetical protein